ncbi:MAG: N-acetylmuramoyl-L-alanine amidase [Litoreibacter sp.]|nr:N-acetylmuramoyl-L-alanine amidase [Litoreibacter sp.]
MSHPSPNFGERKHGGKPDFVVLHYTAMVDAGAACRTLCNPETEVSSQNLISETGQVHSLVDENMRAWHAGVGSWGNVTDVNSHSIGIELANDGFSPFANKLMNALEDLLAAILERWDIPPHRVIAHSDLAPGRKIDPGPRFDWQRLAQENLAIWPNLRHARIEDFQEAACAFGYSPLVDDLTRLQSFRLRFRHGFSGPLDEVDAGLAVDLAERFSIDRLTTAS